MEAQRGMQEGAMRGRERAQRVGARGGSVGRKMAQWGAREGATVELSTKMYANTIHDMPFLNGSDVVDDMSARCAWVPFSAEAAVYWHVPYAAAYLTDRVSLNTHQQKFQTLHSLCKACSGSDKAIQDSPLEADLPRQASQGNTPTLRGQTRGLLIGVVLISLTRPFWPHRSCSIFQTLFRPPSRDLQCNGHSSIHTYPRADSHTLRTLTHHPMHPLCVSLSLSPVPSSYHALRTVYCTVPSHLLFFLTWTSYIGPRV